MKFPKTAKTISLLIIAIGVVSGLIQIFSYITDIPSLPKLITLILQALPLYIPFGIAVIVAIGAGCLGYVLGRLSSHKGGAIKTITFEYRDPPTSHDWKITNIEKNVPPTFSAFEDGYFHALSIQTPTNYSMEREIEAMVRHSASIEFIAKLTENARFFAEVVIKNRDNSHFRNFWLKFCLGIGKPIRVDHDDSNWYEYQVFIQPTRFEGEWGVFEIDLKKAVEDTAGQDGWTYARQLKKLRLKGNLMIAKIKLNR